MLKSDPSLHNCGKTTTSRSEGQATESALCKPSSIRSETAVKVSLVAWTRKPVKGSCVWSEDSYTQQQSSCPQQMLGSRDASLQLMFRLTPVMNFARCFTHTTKRRAHAHTKCSLGLSLSLRLAFISWTCKTCPILQKATVRIYILLMKVWWTSMFMSN